MCVPRVSPQDAANTKAISTAAVHWGKSEAAAAKMRTMTSYCRSSGNVKSVPDPYYGGPQVRIIGTCANTGTRAFLRGACVSFSSYLFLFTLKQSRTVLLMLILML